MEDVVVRNIYEINGYIDQNNNFVQSNTIRSYISEIMEPGKHGYSYYSFLVLRKSNTSKYGYIPQTTYIRISSLDEFVNNPNVKVLKRPKNDRLVSYFLQIHNIQPELESEMEEELSAGSIESGPTLVKKEGI